MIPHCTACAADAEVAHEGCGDPSCCGPTYCLPCGCARGEVCTLEGDNSDCAGCAACSRAPSTCLVAVMVRERAAAKEVELARLRAIETSVDRMTSAKDLDPTGVCNWCGEECSNAFCRPECCRSYRGAKEREARSSELFTLSCDHCGGAAITSPDGLFSEQSSDRCESCGYPGGVVIEESGEDEDGETVYSATWVSGIEPGDVCDACVCSECDAIREWPRR